MYHKYIPVPETKIFLISIQIAPIMSDTFKLVPGEMIIRLRVKNNMVVARFKNRNSEVFGVFLLNPCISDRLLF